MPSKKLYKKSVQHRLRNSGSVKTCIEPRYQYNACYFPTLPITYSSWTPRQRLHVHEFMCWTAIELSRKFPLFEPGDLYNSGYIRYLEVTQYMTFTIKEPGVEYVKIAVKGSMIKEIWKLYGRPTYKATGYVGKGDRQNLAERIGKVSLDGPAVTNEGERFNSFKHKELHAEWMKGDESE